MLREPLTDLVTVLACSFASETRGGGGSRRTSSSLSLEAVKCYENLFPFELPCVKNPNKSNIKGNVGRKV